jgi:hypothetical protein
MKLEWAYAIETCPKDKPFIYMLISPTMTTHKANELTDIAQRTLPEGRTMFVSSGPLRAFNIKQYDNAEKEVLDYINVSTPHSYWLARSFVLLSDVYMKNEKYIEAKQYLISLKQSYQAKDDIASMIEERLKTLENMTNN